MSLLFFMSNPTPLGTYELKTASSEITLPENPAGFGFFSKLLNHFRKKNMDENTKIKLIKTNTHNGGKKCE